MPCHLDWAKLGCGLRKAMELPGEQRSATRCHHSESAKTKLRLEEGYGTGWETEEHSVPCHSECAKPKLRLKECYGTAWGTEKRHKVPCQSDWAKTKLRLKESYGTVWGTKNRYRIPCQSKWAKPMLRIIQTMEQLGQRSATRAHVIQPGPKLNCG